MFTTVGISVHTAFVHKGHQNQQKYCFNLLLDLESNFSDCSEWACSFPDIKRDQILNFYKSRVMNATRVLLFREDQIIINYSSCLQVIALPASSSLWQMESCMRIFSTTLRERWERKREVKLLPDETCDWARYWPDQTLSPYTSPLWSCS